MAEMEKTVQPMEPAELVESLWQKLKTTMAEAGGKFQMDVVERAFILARDKHDGQLRKSGEPYIIHPLAVATIVVELGMDTESVAAALLHDVIEDTEATVEDVTRMFGRNIALLIDGVTKIGRIPYSSREEQQAENIRKMLIAMADDIRVIIIKLADRLHNMRTCQFWAPQKRRDKALENMEVYAPIAHRLGIRAVKEELEDISIRCLDPIGYEEIEKSLTLRHTERRELIRQTKAKIRDRVSETIPDAYLEGRVKSINGIYRKMYMQGRSFDEIYDIYAVRVIVNSIIDCYNVLGIIHDMYTPIPNRFKDYISTPKQNMYQSLHTTVLSKDGIAFEVQIRTWDMHHTAEYGIAAHWKYKQAGCAGRSGGVDPPSAGESVGRWRRDRTDQFHQNRHRAGGSLCLYAQGRCHPSADGGHGHRLCLRHPQCRRQPDGGGQGGQSHRTD